jgi:hypothetical protein
LYDLIEYFCGCFGETGNLVSIFTEVRLRLTLRQVILC